MKAFSIFLLLLSISCCSLAQQKDSTGIRVLGVDSVAIKKVTVTDSTKKKHNPRKATIRSAIIPGWGQAYNRKYWKIPIVYAALGITGAVFNYNLTEYRKIRFAYFTLINKDTANFKNVSPELQQFVTNGDSYSLQRYRTEFRKNIDYSVLFFLLFWGLNVVDATVDGHLKDFDVNDNLSLKIKPQIAPIPGNSYMGVSFIFTIGKNHSNRITSLR